MLLGSQRDAANSVATIIRNTRREFLTCLNLQRKNVARFMIARSALIARLRGDYIPESFGAAATLRDLSAARDFGGG